MTHRRTDSFAAAEIYGKVMCMCTGTPAWSKGVMNIGTCTSPLRKPETIRMRNSKFSTFDAAGFATVVHSKHFMRKS